MSIAWISAKKKLQVAVIVTLYLVFTMYNIFIGWPSAQLRPQARVRHGTIGWPSLEV
jgi:hypothetical protein